MTTNQLVATRPESNEYAPYYDKYISLVPEGDILVTLENQLPATLALLARPESDGDFRYAPGNGVSRNRWDTLSTLSAFSATGHCASPATTKLLSPASSRMTT